MRTRISITRLAWSGVCRHLPLALTLLLAACQCALTQSAGRTLRTAAGQLVTVGGAVYDAFCGEYTQLPDKYDVRIGWEGRVLLRDVQQSAKEESALDGLREYRFNVPAGVYEIQFSNTRQIMPYRRAHVRLVPTTPCWINMYLVDRTGISETISGDIALPDPKLAYDDYHPDAKDPEIDLLVQYGSRTSGATGIEYSGPFLMLTFDTLTLRAKTCVLDPRTLRTVVTKDVLVDFGKTRIQTDRAELSSHDRVVKVFLAEGVQEYRF